MNNLNNNVTLVMDVENPLLEKYAPEVRAMIEECVVENLVTDMVEKDNVYEFLLNSLNQMYELVDFYTEIIEEMLKGFQGRRLVPSFDELHLIIYETMYRFCSQLFEWVSRDYRNEIACFNYYTETGYSNYAINLRYPEQGLLTHVNQNFFRR